MRQCKYTNVFGTNKKLTKIQSYPRVAPEVTQTNPKPSERGEGTRSAPEPSDPARGDCAAERRGRGRSDFAPRMCGAWRGEERAHGAEPPPPSGAELKQRGGITPPAGQASDERAGGEGGRGEGTGDNTPATRQRAQRTAKKRLPEHLSAAAETSGLDGREARTGA